MLSILLLAQFISWFPWQFFTIFNETAPIESDLDSNVSYHPPGVIIEYTWSITPFMNVLQYVEIISPIMFYVKFYFVFTGSMLNPICKS